MAESEKLPLSPMLVQYLVGLCALKWDAAAVNVDVTLGDMVEDVAAKKPRDVDVTVTVDTPEGVYAFKGFEVKHWSNPLDVSDVEALVAKFNDMPSVTHRAIVSSSGFSEAAVAKATHHNVELLTFAPWDRPISEQFPFLANMKRPPKEHINGNFIHLHWNNAAAWVGTNSPPVNFQPDQQLYDAIGKSHPKYPSYSAYTEALLLRSSDVLSSLKPIRDMALPLVEALFDRRPDPLEPQWHWGYTAEAGGDAVYFKMADGKLYQIETFTIYGMLQWKRASVIYSVLERVPGGEAFAGAIIAPSNVEGRMSVIIFPANKRELSFDQVQLQQKHLNSIRDLKIATGQE
jgi:hypothetical protein